ncbi:hypothetical protein EC988_001895 [Linderina pennispora]|nr:hypothetical protein EC988_001895 [Linderina pennispora]
MSSLLKSPAARRLIARAAPRALTTVLRSTAPAPRLLHRPQAFDIRRQYTTLPATPLTRAQALEQLHSSDIKQAYKLVRHLRDTNQLVDMRGEPVRNVIQDTQLVQLLTRAIAQQALWEDVLDGLDLILAVRPQKQHTDRRLSDTGYASEQADTEAVEAILEAVLSRQFAVSGDRELAGLTALQVFADCGLDQGWLRLRIRALGFASSARGLREAVGNAGELGKEDRFELAVAYARCLDYDRAVETLRGVTGLSNAQQIEAQAALSLCLAETARLDEAMAVWEATESNDAVWADQAGRMETGFHVQMQLLAAGMRSVVPRLPFTQNLHTRASRAHSSKYAQGLADHLLQEFSSLRERMKQTLHSRQWQNAGLARRLFDVECLAHVLATTAGQPVVDSLGSLSKRLHKHLAAGQTVRPLRGFLWAVLLAPQMSQQRKLAVVRSEIAYARRHGHLLSVAELEPALLALLPESVWKTARRGNFRDASAFVPADGFLQRPSHYSMHPCADELLELARQSMRQAESDSRLAPVCAWIAVLRGRPQTAMAGLEAAVEGSSVCIMPGSLALVSARSQAFFEHMFCVMSMFRRGADAALQKLVPLLLTQQPTVPITPRVAASILYCCVTSRNRALALDITRQLDQQSPRIQELLMRVHFATGQLREALAVFQELNYGGRTQPSEASFALIVRYMGAQRASAVGAEHAFSVCLQTLHLQGRVSPAVWAQWQQASKEGGRVQNMFEPEGEPVGAALERVGVERRDAGALASRRYMRDWEFVLVLELVGAYVNAGGCARSMQWEQWLLEALRTPKFRLKPDLIARIAFVQRLHLKRQSWDGAQMCLDYMVAIDRNLPTGLFRKTSMFLNQLPVLKQLAKQIASDPALELRVKEHLEQQQAAYIFTHIQKFK